MKIVLLSITATLALSSCGGTSAIDNTPTAKTVLDESFAQKGVLEFAKERTFVPLVLQSTDKIVGYTFDASKPEAEQVHQLARLNADGSFDSSFTSGISVGLHPEDEVLRLPDDSLVKLEIDALLHTTRVVKYTSAGMIVNVFGTNGSLNLSFETRGAREVCIDSRNSDIVLPVAASPGLTLNPVGAILLMARITAEGQMPGEYGFKTTPLAFGRTTRCVVTSSGEIIIGGYPIDQQFWSENFRRYTADGTSDGNYGFRLTGDGAGQLSSAMILDQDDRLLLASKDGISLRTYFGRLTINGVDDSSFNWTAFYATPTLLNNPRLFGFNVKTSYQLVNHILPLPNRGMVLIGDGNQEGTALRVTQLKTNGDLEPMFNQTGQFVIDTASRVNWAARTSDGQLLVFTFGAQAKLFRINLAP
jgi:Domain of unknown function (DUF5122) beta-propeller